MITIDRDSSTSVHDQLVEQLRFLIANGHFKVNEPLPSTRSLGKQIGISFHTVRKAYQQLEGESRLKSKVGSGYWVVKHEPLNKSDRNEKGATIFQEAIQRLFGLGLEYSEIEYLFHEQLDALSTKTPRHKVVFVAPYREMADICAEQLSDALQIDIESVLVSNLARHQDANFILARFSELGSVMNVLPRADTLGVVTFLSPKALSKIARLLPHQSLSIITRFEDAIPPLMAEVRAQTGYTGQTLAASIDQDPLYLRQLIEQSDLLVYSPPCKRKLSTLIDDDSKHEVIYQVVSPQSFEQLRESLPI